MQEKKNKKTSFAGFKLTKEEKEILKEYSQRARLTISGYVRLMTIGKN